MFGHCFKNMFEAAPPPLPSYGDELQKFEDAARQFGCNSQDEEYPHDNSWLASVTEPSIDYNPYEGGDEFHRSFTWGSEQADEDTSVDSTAASSSQQSPVSYRVGPPPRSPFWLSEMSTRTSSEPQLSATTYHNHPHVHASEAEPGSSTLPAQAFTENYPARVAARDLPEQPVFFGRLVNGASPKPSHGHPAAPPISLPATQTAGMHYSPAPTTNLRQSAAHFPVAPHSGAMAAQPQFIRAQPTYSTGQYSAVAMPQPLNDGPFAQVNGNHRYDHAAYQAHWGLTSSCADGPAPLRSGIPSEAFSASGSATIALTDVSESGPAPVKRKRKRAPDTSVADTSAIDPSVVDAGPSQPKKQKRKRTARAPQAPAPNPAVMKTFKCHIFWCIDTIEYDPQRQTALKAFCSHLRQLHSKERDATGRVGCPFRPKKGNKDKCDMITCTRAASGGRTFERHIATHVGGLEICCSSCSKQYHRSDELMRHLRNDKDCDAAREYQNAREQEAAAKETTGAAEGTTDAAEGTTDAAEGTTDAAEGAPDAGSSTKRGRASNKRTCV